MNIGSLRSAGAFMRTVAGIVLVTFTAVTISPSAQAMQQHVAQQNVQEQIDAAEHSSVSRNLRSVKERLRVLADRAPSTPVPSATVDQRRTAREELRAWRSDYRELKSTLRSEFESTGALLKRKNLPQIILDRHAAAVAKFESESAALEQEIDATIDSSDDEVAAEKAKAAFNRLDKAALGRAQQHFDPSNLPNRALKANPERKPKLTSEAFQAALLVDESSIRLAQARGFDFSQLSGAGDPSYLESSVEVALTSDVQAKAQELNRDPIAIYNWVRNNIHWQPTWGAIQDASHTLSSQRGNAFDIASLTIALLRASGIPARYVHGTVEVPEAQFRSWMGGFQNIDAAIDFASAGGIPITAVIGGGRITRVRVEHIWVEAAIDFVPSRGARNRVADTWVAIDPSFKQSELLPGLDAVRISGIDPEQLSQTFLASGTVNEPEGWVAGFNSGILQNAQLQAKTALQTYIDQNLQNATVGDIFGGRRIVAVTSPVLPTGMPNRVIVTGARYAQIPALLQQKITFAFGKDVMGDPVNPSTFAWARLNSRQVTLSFRPAAQADEDTLRALLPEGQITDISQLPASIPAYLIRVVPELKVDGAVLMSGGSTTLGTDVDFVFSPTFVSTGIQPFSYKVSAGSYLAVAVMSGSINPAQLERTKQSLQVTQAVLAAGNPAAITALTRERFFGDMFHGGLLGYYAQYSALGFLYGLVEGGHHGLAAGVGSFGYEPEVDSFFGVPRRLLGGGATMNIPIVNVVSKDRPGSAGKSEFTLKLGALSSVLEHAVPEQMFGSGSQGEGISAMKALQKAVAAGQRIYQVTSSNQSTVLPLIHHDAQTMEEIRVAIAAGRTVITHGSAVGVPGWFGAGYIAVDTETGAAAWKISGGANGSFYDFCQGEGAKYAFCSLYVWVYDCVNPANGDLSCSVGYVFAAAIIALLGPVGATIAAIAAAMELYAQFDSLWYSDQPGAVLLGAGLLAIAGIVLSLLFAPTLIGGLALSLLIMFLMSALATFVRPPAVEPE